MSQPAMPAVMPEASSAPNGISSLESHTSGYPGVLDRAAEVPSCVWRDDGMA